VTTQGLVKGLSERELTNPEGAGFDLRLGQVYKLVQTPDAYLGIKDRKTPDIELIASYKNDKEVADYIIGPGDFVLVRTIESVKLPVDIAGYCFTRSTLFRSGLELLCTQAAPGYEGELTFGLKNVGPMPIKIEMGARIAHIQFEPVDGGGNAYRGQWQGGRVSTDGEETQV